MRKHTAGPWKVIRDKQEWLVTGIEAGDGRDVCGMTDRNGDDTCLEADAALIASAPDMLAELKQIQAELLEHDNADAELASRLYRIIAKAEGRKL